MFTVKHIKDKTKTSNYIEVNYSDKTVYAKIDLKLGGSLQELILNNNTIISSKDTLPYEGSYASAILFPFVNRIENGRYEFNNKSYQLPINKGEENNALHGLVYNKNFDIVQFSASEKEAVINVRYFENGESSGFPFKYLLTLSYIIKKASVELIIEVKNRDEFSFPFTIGWHPYFVSSSLEKSFLKLNCGKKIVVNDQRIPINEETVDLSEGILIDEKDLDDCFILNNNHLYFYTPDYKLDFSFSTDIKYLQLYVPPNRKTIAIEPQSGSANSFNNHRGLKILHPQELYETRWKIEVNPIVI
jgi:aldose 1-epimerase